MLDLRRLHFFVTVAECLNMSRAAEMLNISQSALSRQIQTLEAEIGVQLFDRIGKRLVMTVEGEHLLVSAASLIEQAIALSSRAQSMARAQIGLIRIGATPQTITSLLSRALITFRARHPGIEVTLKEGSNDVLLEMVERGSIHVALAALPLRHDLSGEDLFLAQLLVFPPPNDPRARAATLSIEQIASDPLLLLRRGFMTRDLFDRSCLRKRLRPRILLESDSPHALIALAQAGHGLAVLSSSAAIRPDMDRAIPLTLGGRAITQMVSVVWNPNRHRPPALPFLLETLKEHAAGWGVPSTKRRRRVGEKGSSVVGEAT